MTSVIMGLSTRCAINIYYIGIGKRGAMDLSLHPVLEMFFILTDGCRPNADGREIYTFTLKRT